MGELMTRLRVALRAPAADEESPAVETADFTIDLVAKRVRRNGADVRLTATEWQVVELLARNPGRLVTQRQLLEKVWGLRDAKAASSESSWPPSAANSNHPAHPRYFLTEPGSGIRFLPEGAPEENGEGDRPG
jgi:two-component system KDP operon response regulator KdpE